MIPENVEITYPDKTTILENHLRRMCEIHKIGKTNSKLHNLARAGNDQQNDLDQYYKPTTLENRNCRFLII